MFYHVCSVNSEKVTAMGHSSPEYQSVSNERFQFFYLLMVWECNFPPWSSRNLSQRKISKFSISHAALHIVALQHIAQQIISMPGKETPLYSPKMFEAQSNSFATQFSISSPVVFENSEISRIEITL